MAKIKHRVPNFTGGYVLLMDDGTVKFDLYPDDKEQGERSKRSTGNQVDQENDSLGNEKN